MVHFGPPWQPMHAPSFAKRFAPAATFAGSSPVAPRGERIVWTNRVMAAQFVSTLGAVSASGLAGSAASAAEPFRPPLPFPFAHVGFTPVAHPVRTSIRSPVAGGVLFAETIAPTPPEMPRVLASKSASSSLIPVQLRILWSLTFALLNVPSRLVDCRGPRAKYHVTLSVSPSEWHDWQAPHPCPFSDQRPTPVLKKRFPARIVASSDPAGGSADSCTTLGLAAPPATACAFRSIRLATRVTSLVVSATFFPVLLVANPIGLSPALALGMPTGSRSMKFDVEAPTDFSVPAVGSNTMRKAASAPLAET